MDGPSGEVSTKSYADEVMRKWQASSVWWTLCVNRCPWVLSRCEAACEMISYCICDHDLRVPQCILHTDTARSGDFSKVGSDKPWVG